jgi:hypothetical protein
MSDRSAIEWTDATWNPVRGCTKVSPGCKFCYCIAGKFVVRMVETNVNANISPGDFFEIPAGHDAYVEGDERVELVLFAPPDHAP